MEGGGGEWDDLEGERDDSVVVGRGMKEKTQRWRPITVRRGCVGMLGKEGAVDNRIKVYGIELCGGKLWTENDRRKSGNARWALERGWSEEGW